MVTSKKFFKEIASDTHKKNKERKRKKANINYRILMGYDYIIFP
jgi:hypothetical protein